MDRQDQASINPEAPFDRLFNAELTPAERDALAERIEHDPATQQAFDEALRLEGLLHAAHAAQPGRKAAPAPLRLSAHHNGLLLALASLLALAVCAFVLFEPQRRPEHAQRTPAPAERRAGAPPVQELAGMRCALFGVVEEEFDGSGFRFRVTRVFRRFDGTAKPQGVEGRTFAVRAGIPNADGGYLLDRRQVAFLQDLRKGQRMTLAVEAQSGGLLHLVEVPVAIGDHFPGQCACLQGKRFGPALKPQDSTKPRS